MLISSERPGPGCAKQGETQKNPKKVTGLLPNSLCELDSGLYIQKLSFVGSQKYYRAASP